MLCLICLKSGINKLTFPLLSRPSISLWLGFIFPHPSHLILSQGYRLLCWGKLNNCSQFNLDSFSHRFRSTRFLCWEKLNTCSQFLQTSSSRQLVHPHCHWLERTWCETSDCLIITTTMTRYSEGQK